MIIGNLLNLIEWSKEQNSPLVQVTLTVSDGHARERLGRAIHEELKVHALHPHKIKWDRRTILKIAGIQLHLEKLAP